MVVASLSILFGYYQIFTAWRAAWGGKINGFAWEYALIVLMLIFLGDAAVTEFAPACAAVCG